MGILDALGIVGGIASIAGVIAAFYFARKNRRIKLLTFDTTVPLALASAISPDSEDFNLTVVYKPKGGRQKKMKSVNVRFVRFANLGREPIRREDIAPSEPLRVNVRGVQTLDISLAGVSREVANLSIENDEYGDADSGADIVFDYLDHNDGGVIKIVTVGSRGDVILNGAIIGMPDGIKPVDQLRSMGLINKIGCGIAGIIELAAVASVPFISYWVTGSWVYVWLLILPFVALFVPAILIGIVAATIWPNESPSLPSSLALPTWARRMQSMQFRAAEMVHDPRVLIELENARTRTGQTQHNKRLNPSGESGDN